MTKITRVCIERDRRSLNNRVIYNANDTWRILKLCIRRKYFSDKPTAFRSREMSMVKHAFVTNIEGDCD